MRKREIAVLAMATFLALVATAKAEEPDLYARPYKSVVVDQPIRDALADFGRNLKISVAVSEGVKGNLRQQAFNGTAREFLEKLVTLGQIAWYFDGALLHVGPRSEMVTEIIDVRGLGPGRVKSTIDMLGAIDGGSRVAIRDGLLRVSALPQFAASLRQGLDALHATSSVEVHVFKSGQSAEVVKVRQGGGKRFSHTANGGSIVFLRSKAGS